MPKARLSNDKGLVQSSGDGLQLTPANSNGAGMHFKTIRVELNGLTGSNTNNAIVKDLGSIPAQSAVIGVTAVLEDVADVAKGMTFSLTAGASGQVVGHTIASGLDIISSVNAGTSHVSIVQNLTSGSFLDAAKALGTRDTLYLCEDLAKYGGTVNFKSGSLVFNLAYAGVES
tara:strand:+ start:416 stop:934 length:519 start_codon:yes stop_codon:yes gene_type:complete